MGNAHAIAAKRLPSVVPPQQTAPHSLSRTSTAAASSNAGIFGSGAFVNGISQAAAALRASLGVGSAVDATLPLDHEDILYVTRFSFYFFFRILVESVVLRHSKPVFLLWAQTDQLFVQPEMLSSVLRRRNIDGIPGISCFNMSF